MARFRNRGMGLRPVNRIKHVVDAQGSVDDAPQAVVDLINTVDSPVLVTPNEVVIGSRISGIYLNVESLHSSGVGLPNIYMYIMKNPGANLNNPQANNVGTADEKKFVIHQEMKMLSGDAGSGLPRVIFNGVIVIPKHYQRFGPKDKLQFVIRTGTANLLADWCLQCHYKEFR